MADRSRLGTVQWWHLTQAIRSWCVTFTPQHLPLAVWTKASQDFASPMDRIFMLVTFAIRTGIRSRCFLVIHMSPDEADSVVLLGEMRSEKKIQAYGAILVSANRSFRLREHTAKITETGNWIFAT
jgi:hypothetical protein